MLEKEFVPYQESLELKKLGFDEPCFATIDQTESVNIKGTEHTMGGAMFYFTINAPTFSQAFRFFRDKYDLRSWIESFNKTNYKAVILNHYGSTFNSNEEAELECLRKLIELVKNK